MHIQKWWSLTDFQDYIKNDFIIDYIDYQDHLKNCFVIDYADNADIQLAKNKFIDTDYAVMKGCY